MTQLPLNREELVARMAGETFEFFFFWGHTPPKDGGVNRSCLSQWFATNFIVDGIEYRTAEHWMMAEKARLFGDVDVLETILTARTAAAAKAAGRAVRGYSESAWEAARYEVVVAGNLAKFTQHDDLGRYLVSTGDRVLVEASPLDRVWGIGLAEDDEAAASPSRWRGRNLLGFALMDVRERLQSG
jgi:ribA/ribD-fused uncharacterized protein